MLSLTLIAILTLVAILTLPLPLPTLALNITILQPSTPFVPSPLPPPSAASHSDAIVAAFSKLGRTTTWKLISAIPFQGDTYEPEGITRIGEDRYLVSAGEYTELTQKFGTNPGGSSVILNGTDRTAGAGFAHLIVFDGNGSRIADATLTERGAIEYHNGGIDYDGKYIWATIAQYRPNTTATLVRIDPSTLEPTTISHISDHQGGVVHDTSTDKLYTLNWGSRNSTSFLPNQHATYISFTSPIRVQRNPSYFIDYQDCKFLGHPAYYQHRSTMLCSGIATLGSADQTFNLGGLAIVDTETMTPLDEVPVVLQSELGVNVAQNPMDVGVVDGKLRVYWLPDQRNSTLYVYEAQPGSPFEYGGDGGGAQSFEHAR